MERESGWQGKTDSTQEVGGEKQTQGTEAKHQLQVGCAQMKTCLYEPDWPRRTASSASRYCTSREHTSRCKAAPERACPAVRLLTRSKLAVNSECFRPAAAIPDAESCRSPLLYVTFIISSRPLQKKHDSADPDLWYAVVTAGWLYMPFRSSVSSSAPLTL